MHTLDDKGIRKSKKIAMEVNKVTTSQGKESELSLEGTYGIFQDIGWALFFKLGNGYKSMCFIIY